MKKQTEKKQTDDWEKVFDMFFNKEESGGSSRWLVMPDTVRIFIKGLLRNKR